MQTPTLRRKETSMTEPHRLNPVTSLSTSRYNRSCYVQVCPRIISKGPAPRPTSMQAHNGHGTQLGADAPPNEARFRPRGFPVVTEANIEEVETKAQILDSLHIITRGLQCHDVKVPPRCELFLELDEDRSVGNYYFVDHVSKELFWLEDMGTEWLGIPAATSSSQSHIALEKFYWAHLEFFPMHHELHEREFSQIVDEIYTVISRADRETFTSTFPYTPDTCMQFSNMLLSSKKGRLLIGQRADGYILCRAARLAGAIVDQQCITFYGQEAAQMNRRQELHLAVAWIPQWLSTVANLMLFGMPRYYISLLEDLHVNDHPPLEQWREFRSLCLTGWTSSLLLSSWILIVTILLVNMCDDGFSIAIPSIISCLLSIVSASCLQLRLRPGESVGVSSFTKPFVAQCPYFLRFFEFVESKFFGFLPLAIVFSLPKAGSIWGICTLVAQVLVLASHSANGVLSLLVAASSLVLAFAVTAWVVKRVSPRF
ncbi:hypothetical protein BU15DRAFT_79229 [Melanogaster broomeanus]|nr:hypothetical protein BU15DRAFT_79229 [Melanogaster broomeanus]